MKFLTGILILTKTLFASNYQSLELYQQLKAGVQGRGDVLVRRIQRVGQNTLKLSGMISSAMNLETAPKVFEALERYPEWSLHGLNTKPGGGNYYMQLKTLKLTPHPKQLDIFFELDLPLLKPIAGNRVFNIEVKNDKGYLEYIAKMEKQPDTMIKEAELKLSVFPAEGQKDRAWIAMEGEAKLAWLLYEALPEKLLNTEVTPRIKQLLTNYISEEDRIIERILSSTHAK